MEGFFGYKYGRSRGWEMLPGLLVWGTFVLSAVFSFFAPFWVIVFIIVFDVYWLFRVAYFVVFLLVAWRRVRATERIDWEAKLAELPNAENIHHLIFLPTYKEDVTIIRSTLKSLRASKFPTKRMIVVLAGEGRDHDNFVKNAATMTREFGHAFKAILVTEHPAGLPDEIPGKGSNLNWAGARVAEMLTKDFSDLADKDIVVSSFDVDTIAHPQYFAYLTYLYCTVPNPTRTSYQPVALFSNTIWTAPAPVRIAAFGTTFWLMGELARPERLWTFSSHSMPWTMLKDVGFWQKDIVSEDSRIFLQALVHYHGDYRVTPMYLPVSMDAVAGDTYLESLQALYKQQRRWAWGVEHLPAMMRAFKADKAIPLSKKLRYIFNHLEGMYTWATAPILIFLLGQLPLALIRDPDALIQAAPFTLQHIMQLAMAGVFVSGILSLTLLPPRPKSVRPHAWVTMIAQWLLLPVTFILFGALPAIDAQTRFMFGNYLGFNVTKKGRYMTPRVCVNVVSWNSMAYLPELFASLATQTFTDFQVLLVDNASSDGVEAYVRANFPTVTLLRNARNLGFSVAHNQGIRYALDRWGDEERPTRYVVVMNPDTILTPTCLERLVADADAHPEAGSFGPKLLRAFGENLADEVMKETVKSDIIDSTGLSAHKNRTFTDRGAGEIDTGQYDQNADVFGLSGALSLCRAGCLADAAVDGEYFDTDFFAYKEDIDLAWRMRLLGWGARYVPDAVAYHYRGMFGKEKMGWFERIKNRRGNSRLRSYYSTRNHWLTLKKNELFLNGLLALPRIAFREALRVGYVALFEPRNLGAFFGAFVLIPKMWRKRRSTMRRRKATAGEMRKWFR